MDIRQNFHEILLVIFLCISPGLSNSENEMDHFDADKCASINCTNGGICKVIENEPVCECPEEYTGYTCQAHKCDRLVCQNNGTCNVEQGQARCNCPEDFGGELCEFISEAKCSRYRKNCQETHGYCKLVKEEIQCKCGSSSFDYQQDLGCVYDIYFCGKNYPGCLQTGGICIRHSPGFTKCRCPKGTHYYGNEGGCKVTDPCKNSRCENGGTCLVRGSNFTCTCEEPFTGATCNEIQKDFCSRYKKNCEETGGYCKFDGDKELQCNCKDAIDSYKAYPKYQEDTGCLVDNVTCKIHRAFCLETGGYCIGSEIRDAVCICPKGFEYRIGCENACSKNPCLNGGKCQITGDDFDSFECVCEKPFTGKHCEISST